MSESTWEGYFKPYLVNLGYIYLLGINSHIDLGLQFCYR